MCGAEVSLIVMYPDGKSTQGNMFRFETRDMGEILQMWNSSPGKKELCSTKDYQKFAAQASKEKDGKRKNPRDDDDFSPPYVEPLETSSQEELEQPKKQKKECDQSKTLMKTNYYTQAPTIVAPTIMKDSPTVPVIMVPALPVAKEIFNHSEKHHLSILQHTTPLTPTGVGVQEVPDFFRLPSIGDKLDELGCPDISNIHLPTYQLQTTETLVLSPGEWSQEEYPQNYLGFPCVLQDS